MYYRFAVLVFDYLFLVILLLPAAGALGAEEAFLEISAAVLAEALIAVFSALAQRFIQR